MWWCRIIFPLPIIYRNVEQTSYSMFVNINIAFLLLSPWQKKVMFLVELVCLSVCVFVCGQHYSKTYERIVMKFCRGVLGGTMKN